jgi:hypothetical protein
MLQLPFAAQTEFANRGKLSGNWQSHFGSRGVRHIADGIQCIPTKRYFSAEQ